MKERIETPVFVVFIIISLLFSCFTFVLGIWICDSSHQIDKQLSQMKIVEKDTLDMNADENEYPYQEEDFSYNSDSEDSSDLPSSKESSDLSPKLTDSTEQSSGKKQTEPSSSDTQKKPNVKKEESVSSSAKRTPSESSVKNEQTTKSAQSGVKSKPESSVKAANTQNTSGSKLYYIQIIATSSKKTAEKTKQRLEKKGYNVYLLTDKKNNQILYKIRVGTFRTRTQAMKIASKIEKEEKIKPWVL